jgi:hypothetical protein
MNITKELEELNQLQNKQNMDNYKEKEKITNSATNTFAEIVKSVAESKKESLIKVVEKYDQEHLTREELTN